MKKTEAKKSRATVPLRKKISYLIEENILLHAKALSDAQMVEESALLHLQGKGLHHFKEQSHEVFGPNTLF
jgi:hypothetical protein